MDWTEEAIAEQEIGWLENTDPSFSEEFNGITADGEEPLVLMLDQFISSQFGICTGSCY